MNRLKHDQNGLLDYSPISEYNREEWSNLMKLNFHMIKNTSFGVNSEIFGTALIFNL